MESVIRTLGIYFFLLFVFRVAGKRSLQDITLFDFVLLLVISESVQEALVGEDYSMTNAWIVIATFLVLDIGMSLLKQKIPRLGRLMDGLSILVVEDGKPLRSRMQRERIDVEDILEAARDKHGLSRFDQIKYAVLERNGSISIIPREQAPKSA
jgi:uncharacterized membrane protein YcaP (DUF421 family)